MNEKCLRFNEKIVEIELQINIYSFFTKKRHSIRKNDRPCFFYSVGEYAIILLVIEENVSYYQKKGS